VVTVQSDQVTFATVFVDGAKLGNSPILRALPAGHHRVHVERAGFKSVDRSITVSPGETTRLRIELSP
jgi:hypothetical protein